MRRLQTTIVLLVAAGRAVQFSTRAAPPRFPRRETPPADVVAAQLDAFSSPPNIGRAYDLFSRARRLAITEAAMDDVRQAYPPREIILEKLEGALRESCPGLVGHDRSEVLSGLAISEYDGVHLPQWRCRVRVACAGGTRSYTFHLTRQSDPPPPTIDFDERFDTGRDIDGFEGCWFVARIVPEDGGARVEAPAPLELVPA